MDDQRDDRASGGSMSRYRLKDAARDVLRATVIAACVFTVIGLLGTYFDRPSGKVDRLPPLSERLTVALIMGPLVGSIWGATAGIILAAFRFIKSLIPTT